MHIIWIITIGFIAGLVARILTPGPTPSGFFLTAGLGIAGALIATFAGQTLHIYETGESAGFFGAVVGAVTLICLGHLAFPKK